MNSLAEDEMGQVTPLPLIASDCQVAA